jgi:hypothetical protein
MQLAACILLWRLMRMTGSDRRLSWLQPGPSAHGMDLCT